MVREVGLRGLRRILVSNEVAAADAGNSIRDRSISTRADVFLVGKINLSAEQDLFMPDDLETGRLVSFERSEPIARAANFSFEADANYEQLPYLFDMAVRALTSADKGDASTGFTRTYKQNYTEPNYPRTLTFVYGDNVQLYRSASVGCQQLELSGQVGAEVRVNAGLFGKDMTETGIVDNAGEIHSITVYNGGTGYTNSSVVTISAPGGIGNTTATATPITSNGAITGFTITDVGSGYTKPPTITVASGTGGVFEVNLGVTDEDPPSLSVVKMGDASFYRCANWTDLEALASTDEVKSTLIDFSWRLVSGFAPVKYVDDALYFTDIAENKKHVEMDMTVAFSKNTDARFSTKDWFTQLYRAQKLGYFGLKFRHKYDDKKGLELLQSGKITEFGEISEREGQDIVKLKLVSEWDDKSDGKKDFVIRLAPNDTMAALT